MNPATYLRVNGPEPWNVVYTEPSIRPDDSRYGENPNRLQRHTQVGSDAHTESYHAEHQCRSFWVCAGHVAAESAGSTR